MKTAEQKLIEGLKGFADDLKSGKTSLPHYIPIRVIEPVGSDVLCWADLANHIRVRVGIDKSAFSAFAGKTFASGEEFLWDRTNRRVLPVPEPDPDTMQKAMEDYKAGRFKTADEIIKELRKGPDS